MCGVMVMPGWSHSGSAAVIGSVACTSSAAPARWPDRTAASKSASTTWPPRAMLTRYAPGGIAAKAAASSRPSVCGVSGKALTTIWASASAACSGPLLRRQPLTVKPSASSTRPHSRPTLPQPSTSTFACDAPIGWRSQSRCSCWAS